MQCLKCGCQISEGDSFCENCQREVDSEPGAFSYYLMDQLPQTNPNEISISCSFPDSQPAKEEKEKEKKTEECKPHEWEEVGGIYRK
jgi:hypothetical protein